MMRGDNTTEYKALVKESLAIQENNIRALKGYIDQNDLGREPTIQESLGTLTRLRAQLEEQAAGFDKKSNNTNNDKVEINSAIIAVDHTIKKVNMIAEGVVNLRSTIADVVKRGPNLEALMKNSGNLNQQVKRFANPPNKGHHQQKPMIQRFLDTISKVFNQVVSAIKGLFQKAELPNPRARAGGKEDVASSTDFKTGGEDRAAKRPGPSRSPGQAQEQERGGPGMF